MEASIKLYGIVIFYCINIFILVLFIIITLHLQYNSNNLKFLNHPTHKNNFVITKKLLRKYGVYNNTDNWILETLFVVLPFIIVVLLILPSFSLLYSMQEYHKSEVIIKIVGKQWFWSYEVHNLPFKTVGYNKNTLLQFYKQLEKFQDSFYLPSKLGLVDGLEEFLSKKFQDQVRVLFTIKWITKYLMTYYKINNPAYLHNLKVKLLKWVLKEATLERKPILLESLKKKFYILQLIKYLNKISYYRSGLHQVLYFMLTKRDLKPSSNYTIFNLLDMSDLVTKIWDNIGLDSRNARLILGSSRKATKWNPDGKHVYNILNKWKLYNSIVFDKKFNVVWFISLIKKFYMYYYISELFKKELFTLNLNYKFKQNYLTWTKLLNLNKNSIWVMNRLLDVDNALLLPIHKWVEFLVTSSDVIHSWSIPCLGLKIDATPGHVSYGSTFIKMDKVMYGMCSEYCGEGHYRMPIVIKSYII